MDGNVDIHGAITSSGSNAGSGCGTGGAGGSLSISADSVTFSGSFASAGGTGGRAYGCGGTGGAGGFLTISSNSLTFSGSAISTGGTGGYNEQWQMCGGSTGGNGGRGGDITFSARSIIHTGSSKSIRGNRGGSAGCSLGQYGTAGSIVLNYDTSYDITGAIFSPSPVINYIDMTPPTRSDGSPTGLIATSSPLVSLSTDETATCKYNISPGTAYDSMSLFSMTGGTSHSKEFVGLAEGVHNYYVKCSDSESNINEDDYLISFTIDTEPPIILSATPTGTVYEENQTLHITTDEQAICRYNSTSNTTQANFTNSNSTNHTVNIAATQGENTYYILCNDTVGNSMTQAYQVNFTYTPPVQNVSNSSNTDGNGIVSSFLDISELTPRRLKMIIGTQEIDKPFLRSEGVQTVRISIKVRANEKPVTRKKVKFEIS